MTPTLPEFVCPNCSKTGTDATPTCECGHSYYPRITDRSPVIKPVTEEDRRASCATGGMAVGVASLFAVAYGLLGGLFILLGVGLSIYGLKSQLRTRAVVGLISSCAGVSVFIVVMLNR